ncbi:hypothetical protein ACLDV6_16590 [Acinetobacter baumannii]|uniref:hypothetical protein n=1 Tax=Acinetobacter baumannii TaxID=470 RepID=UPI0028CBD5B4|nr:hypothetical protein [Acinetobacter baumannii]MDT8073244.1 hypothetical protein [Acinetobacter baumannii]MDY7708045.1 hypothetical protein [Acinetobacter baumannii]
MQQSLSKAKWPSEEEIAEKALDSEIIPFVRADALTTCLKTSQNTLSVWAVENCTDAEIEKAILALITNTKLERLNRIQIVYFSKEDVDSLGLPIAVTEGDTIIESLSKLHNDLVDLNYEKLGKVSQLIISSLRSESVRTYNERKLKDMLLKAINEGIVDQKLLHPSLQSKLGLPVLDQNGNALIKQENGEFVKV